MAAKNDALSMAAAAAIKRLIEVSFVSLNALGNEHVALSEEVYDVDCAAAIDAIVLPLLALERMLSEHPELYRKYLDCIAHAMIALRQVSTVASFKTLRAKIKAAGSDAQSQVDALFKQGKV